MAELSVFIPDNVNTARWEAIGNGRCLFLRYKEKPKFFEKRKVKKHLERARGTKALQPDFAERLSLPLLSGDGARLALALFHRLLPKEAQGADLVLSVGGEVAPGAILDVARRVRTLEIIAEGGETLCDLIEEETGLVVPLRKKYTPSEKFCIRLPGGPPCGENALDLADYKKTCVFSPPEALRSVCRVVGSDGDTLEALLRYFEIPYEAAGIFLSKTTKLSRK